MQTTNERTRKFLTLVGLLAAVLMAAGTASARGDEYRAGFDRSDRRARHNAVRTVSHRRATPIRHGRHVERRYDRRGAIINHHLDVVAFFAAVAGDYPLAHALDRRGNRIERRFNRYNRPVVEHVRRVEHRPAHRHHESCGHAWKGSKGKHHRKHFRGDRDGHGRGHGNRHRHR